MVDSRTWWEFQPRQRVRTCEGISGVVDEVMDGPGPGNETYLVTLVSGLGGGEYSASELTALGEPATAAVETAAHWYPELEGVLVDRPPPAASIPADDYHGRISHLAAGLLAESATPTEDPCRCCAGTGEHDNGHECIRCDASGRAEGAEVKEPVPCAGKTAGWVRDLFKTPETEHSYDWCRFRRESHCWYPKGLDEAATKQAGYAVWVPTDRGRCPRGSWALQRACPVGQIGPNAGGYTDATSLETQIGGEAIPGSQHPLHGGSVLSILDPMSHSATIRPDQIVESRDSADPFDDEGEHRVHCPDHPDENAPWSPDWAAVMSDAGRHLQYQHAEGRTAATTTAPAPTHITQAEARGNSRPVSQQEFDQISAHGRELLDGMRRNRAPITGMDRNFVPLLHHAYREVQKPWGDRRRAHRSVAGVQRRPVRAVGQARRGPAGLGARRRQPARVPAGHAAGP